VTLLLEAAPARSRPSQAELHENRIARKAAACISLIWQTHICTLQGYASPGLRALNRDVLSADRPRLREFRFTGGEGGAWVALDSGARGNDLIDLVAYLGVVDRTTAAKYLDDVLREITLQAA
jgi:hypothetical protein